MLVGGGVPLAGCNEISSRGQFWKLRRTWRAPSDEIQKARRVMGPNAAAGRTPRCEKWLVWPAPIQFLKDGAQVVTGRDSAFCMARAALWPVFMMAAKSSFLPVGAGKNFCHYPLRWTNACAAGAKYFPVHSCFNAAYSPNKCQILLL